MAEPSPAANTYGSVAGVAQYIGDISDEGRIFTESTHPSSHQVVNALDRIAEEMNAELQTAGYVVPVDSGDDPFPHAYLADLNDIGACARMLSFVYRGGSFVNPFPEDNDQGGRSRANSFWISYRAGIKRIREQRLEATATDSATFPVRSGARLDDDGNVKKPLFERGSFDEPGSRSLTEA